MRRSAALILSLAATGLSAAPPVWVSRGGSDPTQFPPTTHLLGYGLSEPGGSEAQRLRQAQAMARQELAQALRVQVRSEFTSRKQISGQEGQAYLNSLVQTRSELDLEGLDRFETWTDPKTGLVHALAVLDRARAAGLLSARITEQAREARTEFVQGRANPDALLRVRSQLKRIQEETALLRVLGAGTPPALPADLPDRGEVDRIALELLASRKGLDATLDGAIYRLGQDLPARLRVMIDRIVYGDTRFSASFGAYLEQRLAERMLRFDGIVVLDRAQAAREGQAAQALLHGSYLELGQEVSLLLKATALNGESLAVAQVKLPKAELDKAGLRLLPENAEAAQQQLEILDTRVKETALKVRLSLDRGDGGIYRRGDRLVLFLKANLDCFVRVIYQQVDGSRVQVFPNQFQPEGRLRKDQATQIPPDQGGFTLEVTPPFGSEILKVYASTEPLPPAEGQKIANGFTLLNDKAEAMSAAMRGITVKKAEALVAEDSAVVNTVDLPR